MGSTDYKFACVHFEHYERPWEISDDWVRRKRRYVPYGSLPDLERGRMDTVVKGTAVRTYVFGVSS